MLIGENTKVWHKDKSVILACTVGDNCTIHAPVWIGNDVIIGNNCKVQAFTFIPTGVKIGDNVFIGPHVCFTNDKYPPSNGEWLETIVENNVVIGAGAVITPGITLHHGAIIGAGAVVTKDVPRHTTVVGNPAAPIKPTPRG